MITQQYYISRIESERVNDNDDRAAIQLTPYVSGVNNSPGGRAALAGATVQAQPIRLSGLLPSDIADLELGQMGTLTFEPATE